MTDKIVSLDTARLAAHVTQRDLDILVRTIYGEACSETPPSWAAIASVVCNRAILADRHLHFGDGTLSGACLANAQFSCWNHDDPNRKPIINLLPNDPFYIAIAGVAHAIIDGVISDPTHGATHYYTRTIPTPFWARGKEPCAKIGREDFFNNIA